MIFLQKIKVRVIGKYVLYIHPACPLTFLLWTSLSLGFVCSMIFDPSITAFSDIWRWPTTFKLFWKGKDVFGREKKQKITTRLLVCITWITIAAIISLIWSYAQHDSLLSNGFWLPNQLEVYKYNWSILNLHLEK